MNRLLIALCWVPVALLGALMVYIGRFEGWGQWAAAPLLLLPVFVSLAMTAWGVALVMAARRTKRVAGSALVATVVAALPLLWFGYRLVAS